MSSPVTVFTATVFPDVARLWHGCVSRAFPAGTKIEIFHDSSEAPLDSTLYPGAAILQRTATRRDHHDAYNDAIRRAQTPYLAIVDSDVFWISPDLWGRVEKLLQSPEVAAVSCISRSRRQSHGTYAVVFKPEAYRKVLRDFPDGFYPAAEHIDLDAPLEKSRWFDTGEKMTQAVMDAGYRVELLHLDRSGELIRFYGVTLTRRGGDNFGEATLARISGYNNYFWRGYVSNLVLQALHDNIFAEGARYYFPFRLAPLALYTAGAPKHFRFRLEFIGRMLRGKRKVAQFLRENAPK